MITKIDIKRFGLFNDYDWNATIGKSTIFRRLNIIYGRNYSGKTTLSRIFKCAENACLHKHYKDAVFTLGLEDRQSIDQSNFDQLDKKWKIRVYNTDFVKENLSWIHNDEEGSIEPFTILGAVNVELDKQIKEIDLALGDLDDRNGLLSSFKLAEEILLSSTTQLRKKETEIDEILKKKANDSIKVNQNYFVPSAVKKIYTISDIRSDITLVENDIESFLVDSEFKQESILQLREVQMPDITPLIEARPSFSLHFEETADILRRKIKPSKPIMDLVNDSLLQEWVRQGIDKHKGKRTECAFCGNPIGTELWSKLDAHFSKESEALRNDIIGKIKMLESAKERLHGFLKIDRRQFYSTLQADFDSIFEKWNNQIQSYSRNIDKLIDELQKREQDIFTERDAPVIDDISNELFETIKDINRLIQSHISKTKTLGADHDKLRLTLRLNEVASFLISSNYKVRSQEVSGLKNIVEAHSAELSAKRSEIDDLFKKRRILESQAKDEGRGAELVNNHLTHFFGHSELRLRAVGETTAMKFTIERDGKQANNLSEGECSLISFCYFIARIEDELKSNIEESKLIIYIDDPISSLDSNHVFFMFSLIENVIARPGRYSQLFISTHNLEFLKYLKKLTTPKWKPFSNSDWKSDLNYFIIERTNRMGSKLKLAPSYLKDYITEFNYLFKQIYQCSISDQKDIEHEFQYGFGNNMRKFLESYLFFKYPSHKLTNDQRIQKFFADDRISLSLVNRVTNEYSHLENRFDRSLEPIDVESMKQVAMYVIERIRKSDPDQYEALIDSIK